MPRKMLGASMHPGNGHPFCKSQSPPRDNLGIGGKSPVPDNGGIPRIQINNGRKGDIHPNGQQFGGDNDPAIPRRLIRRHLPHGGNNGKVRRPESLHPSPFVVDCNHANSPNGLANLSVKPSQLRGGAKIPRKQYGPPDGGMRESSPVVIGKRDTFQSNQHPSGKTGAREFRGGGGEGRGDSLEGGEVKNGGGEIYHISEAGKKILSSCHLRRSFVPICAGLCRPVPVCAGRCMPVGICRSVYAGRGLNPRPERSTHARALDECPKTGRFTRGRPCRIWSCGRIFSRGVSFQPCAGRGFNPRPAQAKRRLPRGTHSQALLGKRQKNRSYQQIFLKVDQFSLFSAIIQLGASKKRQEERRSRAAKPPK